MHRTKIEVIFKVCPPNSGADCCMHRVQWGDVVVVYGVDPEASFANFLTNASRDWAVDHHTRNVR